MSQLNTPISVGTTEISNRLVMPPMATALSAEDGLVTDKLCDYYDEKSCSGYIGLIITEHSYIRPDGKASPGQLSIADDSAGEGLKRLVSVMHNNGSKVFAQLNHAGGSTSKEISGYPIISASSVPAPRGKAPDEVPHSMTVEEIEEVITAFAAAAMRAKKAGFDGVEIHSAHGYLLNQFYSPLTNKRTDEYSGCTIEGRIKFHLQVIKAVREAVGNDYPVALRLGACDYRDGGSTIEDSVKAAEAFEKAGIDLIDISGGHCGYIRPDTSEPGYFSEITEAIKDKISIPVILTGGIVEAESAEQMLRENKADMIGVCRAILKDSAWAETAIKRLG
ncbi:NADH:flavin oxidoreductase [Anaerolentibacter hominis]|uniref:NADH:flavin oxidoreductase n=1 Tax=Anaerolentibacter hominis TaxID=3079009 RepID=UPI0031B839E4